VTEDVDTELMADTFAVTVLVTLVTVGTVMFLSVVAPAACLMFDRSMPASPVLATSSVSPRVVAWSGAWATTMHLLVLSSVVGIVPDFTLYWRRVPVLVVSSTNCPWPVPAVTWRVHPAYRPSSGSEAVDEYVVGRVTVVLVADATVKSSLVTATPRDFVTFASEAPDESTARVRPGVTGLRARSIPRVLPSGRSTS